MGLVTLPNTINSGDTDNPSRDMANWTALRDEFNGNIENVNIKSSAAIQISKTTLTTFTDWTTWTPTYGAVGSMTLTGTSTGEQRYCQIGKIVFYVLTFSGTLGGVANNAVTFTLPVAPSYTASAYLIGSAKVTENSASKQGYIDFSTGSTVRVFRYDSANMTLGSSDFFVEGFYRV